MHDKQFIIFSSKIVSLKNTVRPQLVLAFFYPMRASFVFISTLLDFKNILKAMKYRWPCHALTILLLCTIEENWYSKLPILYATNV